MEAFDSSSENLAARDRVLQDWPLRAAELETALQLIERGTVPPLER